MTYDPKTRPLAALLDPDGKTPGYVHLMVPVTVQIGAEHYAGAETVEVIECHRN